MDELVVELRALTPDQFERIAQMVHELSAGRNPPGYSAVVDAQQTAVVPPAVLEQAVRNGWPAALFTEVIGQIGGDFKRISQSPHEARQPL